MSVRRCPPPALAALVLSSVMGRLLAAAEGGPTGTQSAADAVFGAQSELPGWTLDPLRIERTVEVRSLEECQAACARPGTAIRLVADIDAGGQTVFTLKGDLAHILIDGNGHAIRHAKCGVFSDNARQHHIEIRNLTLDGCADGIQLRRDSQVHIHHNTVAGSKEHGIFLENSFGNHGKFFEIHHNRVSGCRKGAITIQDGADDGRIYENDCAASGYAPQANANACLNLDSNIIRVEVFGNRIEGGTFGLGLRGQNNDGMYDCLLRDNVIAAAKHAGIRIGCETFRNTLRNNIVRGSPVGVLYARTYKTSRNFLDGVTIENCKLPIHVDGWPLAVPDGAEPAPKPDLHANRSTADNVDRVLLKDFVGGGPIIRLNGIVQGHTIADAGPWKDGLAVIEGDARLRWASYVTVTVEQDGRAVAGVAVVARPATPGTGTTLAGLRTAETDKFGVAVLGPFTAAEIAKDGVKPAETAEYTFAGSYRGRRALVNYRPDGAPGRVRIVL